MSGVISMVTTRSTMIVAGVFPRSHLRMSLPELVAIFSSAIECAPEWRDESVRKSCVYAGASDGLNCRMSMKMKTIADVWQTVSLVRKGGGRLLAHY